MTPKPHSPVASCALRWRLSLAIAIFCAAPALADDQRVAELEARVAELEAMVQQLVELRTETAVPIEMEEVREQTAATRQQVREIVERIDPLLAAAEKQADGPSFYWGGYVKADVIASSYSDGDLAAGSIGRDFYIPGTIPVGGADESTDLDFHARQSRFHVGSRWQIDEDHQLGAYIEMDFLVTPDGNERVSNSYEPRMRHAFLTYNEWLVGQTWSTYMDVATLPEVLDFIGPAEGTTFVRQSQIRYQNGNFAIAVENPETTVTPFGGGGRIVTDDGLVPDLAARYTWKGDWGHVQLGGLVRQLNYEDPATGINDSAFGWGLSLSGKMNFGRDDLRWMVNTGEGQGRYTGINFANGAVLDGVGDLEAISSTGGFVAYRHWWSEQWRSTAVLSYIDVDNPVDLTGQSVSESAYSAHLNLLYSPKPPLTFGIEYILAEREIESGLSGRMNRLQFSGKYAF
jgi:hypothetical protein